MTPRDFPAKRKDREMRYAVRALGWATKILWILIIVFSVTSVYSAINVRMGFGEPHAFVSNEFFVISVPLFVNNSGLYDLSELNMTVGVMDYDASLLSLSTTFVPLIPRGSSIETAHNVSLSLEDNTSKLLDYLFNDTVFILDVSLELDFAHSIPFRVSTDMSVPWGAPLYNFSFGQFSYNFLNFTHQEVLIPMRFDNHSPYFSIEGLMRVEIYNDDGELLGFSLSDLDVPSHSGYVGQAEAIIDVSKVTGSGEVCFYFETSGFSVGPVVMPYG